MSTLVFFEAIGKSGFRPFAGAFQIGFVQSHRGKGFFKREFGARSGGDENPFLRGFHYKSPIQMIGPDEARRNPRSFRIPDPDRFLNLKHVGYCNYMAAVANLIL